MNLVSILLLLSAHQCFGMGKFYQLLPESNNKKVRSKKMEVRKPAYTIKNSLDKKVQLLFYRKNKLRIITELDTGAVTDFFTNYPEHCAKIEIFDMGIRDPELIEEFELQIGAFEFYYMNKEKRSLALRPLNS